MKSTFPDYYFAWGDFWKENIPFPIPAEQVIVTGYPYLAKEVKKYSSEEYTEQIIVISQPKAGKELSKFALKLENNDHISADVVYKLHPKEYGDWKERYPWLLESGLAIIDDDEPPLYQLLAQSQTLVGAFSTVIYEGFNFGLDTFLLDIPGIQTMEWIFDHENVHVVESIDDFVKVYQTGRHSTDTTQFFADSPVEKLEQAITEIADGTVTTS
jgi:hypothetical protein